MASFGEFQGDRGGRPPKRFIKKVPPSGAAPVFKLTLPHRIVHTHLNHLIDTEFEIAVSATASHSWQGTIAPRRNKDRSEYTLQGWRLFAEAHRVQPGDQVSFELVSPRRLVVQVISTEEAGAGPNAGAGVATQSNSNATSPIMEDNHSPRERELPSILTGLDDSTRRQSWQDTPRSEHLQDMPMGPHMSRPARSTESVSVEGNASHGQGINLHPHQQQLNPQNLALHFNQDPSPTTPASRPIPAPSMPLDSASTPLEMRHRSLEETSMPRGAWNPSILLPSGGPPLRTYNSFPSQGASGLAHEMDPRQRPGSGPLAGGSNSVQLNLQLLNLTSTIQSQQADLQFCEARARKAEYEATQLRLLFSELRASLDSHSRAILLAGEALEKLAGKLSSPEALNAHPAQTEQLLTLQADMFGQVDKLKSSLLHMMSIEL